MFCEKCGNPIPEGQTSCPVCESAPQQEVVEGISPAIAPEAPQEPEFTLNNPAEEAPKAKKGGKIVLMALAAVLALAVLLAAFNWQSIVRYFDRTFSEPADYLTRVEKEAMAEVASDVAEAYDEYLEAVPQGDLRQTTTVTLEFNDSLRTMLGGALSQAGMDLKLDWLNSIALTVGSEAYEEITNDSYALTLNGTHVLSLRVISDLTKGRLHIGIPELSETYLRGEVDIDLDPLSSASPNFDQEVLKMLRVALPSGDELEMLINNYWGIVVDSLGECTKENQKVTCGGLEQELLVISTRLDEKAFFELVEKLIRTAKDDEIIRGFITRYNDYANEISGEDMDFIAEYEKALEEELTEMETLKAEAEEGNYLLIETFIDKDDNIVGRRFEAISVDEEPDAIHYITVTQGKEFAFQLSLNEYYLEGKGSRNGEKTSGSYTIYVEGVDYLAVELDGFAVEENGYDGIVRLRPTKALGELLELPDTVMAVLDTVAVELGYSENTVTILVNVSGSQLLKLSVTDSVEQAAPIAIPNGISISDEGARMDWVAKLDVKAVLNSLEKAGLPQEYLDALNEQIEEILSYIG